MLPVTNKQELMRHSDDWVTDREVVSRQCEGSSITLS